MLLLSSTEAQPHLPDGLTGHHFTDEGPGAEPGEVTNAAERPSPSRNCPTTSSLVIKGQGTTISIPGPCPQGLLRTVRCHSSGSRESNLFYYHEECLDVFFLTLPSWPLL